MQAFEAEQSNALLAISAIWMVLLVILLSPFSLFIFVPGGVASTMCIIFIPLALIMLYLSFSPFYSWFKRRRIKEYQLSDDKIIIKDTGAEIPFEKISDVEIGGERMHKITVHNGIEYYYDDGDRHCTHPMIRVGRFHISRDEVLVYTTTKTILPSRGELNNCFVLNPRDKEGFVKALKVELESYRSRK